MGIFDKLFNRDDKEITSRDLKIALRGVERERRKKQLEIRKLGGKRNDTLEDTDGRCKKCHSKVTPKPQWTIKRKDER